MERTEHKLTLDVHKTVSSTSVSLKRGDTAHRLLITLSEGGYPYHIGEDCTAVFSAVKPDGTTIWNDCTISGDVVIYDMTEQTTAALGVTNCEIQIYDPHGALLTSASFLLLVEEGASNRSAVVSSDEFSMLSTMVANTKAVAVSASRAAERANKAAEACMVIGDASGETIRLDDAIDAEFVGLRIYGKTTQNGTPTPANPATLVSVGALGSIDLTSNDQDITLPISGGLPGIPVASGGNYTDANGQQWICDEIDFANGVYIKRTHTRLLNGSGTLLLSQQGGHNRFEIRYADDYLAHHGSDTEADALCSHFPVSLHLLGSNHVNGIICPYKGSTRIFLRFDECATVEELAAWLSANPVTFVYRLGTPIETDLPDEVMDAYQEYIRSHSGDTAVSNDAGAYMTLEYIMDARKYIDKMISTGIHEATLE